MKVLCNVAMVWDTSKSIEMLEKDLKERVSEIVELF